MNRDRNRSGWKRWVRSSAEEARRKEREYNDKHGGLSTRQRVLLHNDTPRREQERTEQSTLIDRRDESTIESWARSVANGATKFMNDFLNMSVNNAKYKVTQESFNEQDVDKVQRYIDLVSKKKDLEQRLSSNRQISSQGLDNIVQKLKQVNQEKDELDAYFQTDGKNNDAIFNLMYNKENNNFFDYAKAAYRYVKGKDGDLEKSLMSIAYGLTPQGQYERQKKDIRDIWAASKDLYKGVVGDELQPTVGAIEKLSGIIERGWKPLAEIVGTAVRGSSAVANALPWTRSTVRGINSLYQTIYKTDSNFIDSFDDITKKAIRNASIDSDLHKSAYKGENITEEDVNKEKERIASRKEKLIDDFIFEKEAAKAGKVTLFGNTLWSYNPTVDSDWMLEDEAFGDNISDIFTMPTHVLASTASTAQMFKYQLPNMGIEALTSYALKKYGSSVLLSGPTGALIKGALTTATVSSGIAAAAASREAETGDEAVGAYEERVIQDATANGADYEKVQQAVDEFLSQNYPELMNDSASDRLKHAIALGVKTGDDAWDSALQDGRKGLQKLINANNSLALKDYMETLPFLPYTGSLFKNAIKEKVFTDRARLHFVNKGKNPSEEALQRLYRTKGIQQQMAHNFIDPKGIIQRGIDKAAEYFIKKDSPKMKALGLISRDLSMYAINRIPYAVASSITEGIEEGQQELLKERYKRGSYDDYTQPTSMFDLVEGLSTLTLANGAIGDYFGINYGDIDNDSQNVRKVMNIGLASSLLFSNARHALTNVPVLDADNANVRNLFKNIRTSGAVATMMADNYEKAQDYQHASIFYEMINRGATASGISDRLQLMLNSDKNTKVTQQMIDDSKMIAENVEFMHNQKDLAKNLGIKKYSPEYKQVVLEGAVALTDLQKSGQLTSQQGKNIYNKELGLRWDIVDLLNETRTEEQKQELFNNRPILKHLYDNFQSVYTKYQAKQQSKNTSVRLNIAKALKQAVKQNIDPTGNKDFAEKAIQTLAKLGVDEQTAREELDKAISGEENASDIARRLADITTPVYDKNKAFENLVAKYTSYVHELALKRALNLSQQQEKLLQHVRRNTGLDINTNKLRGVISRLRSINEDFIERHRNAGYKPESEGSAFNENSEYDWVYDGIEEFDEWVDDLMSWYINGALMEPMRTVAASYILQSANANRLRQAVTNNKGAFELDDLIDEGRPAALRKLYSRLKQEDKQHIDDAFTEYLNVHGDLITLRDQLSTYGILEEDADYLANKITGYTADPIGSLHQFLEESAQHRKEDAEKAKTLNKEAAKRFILNRLKESESRSRIARRVFIEDAMDNANIEHTEQDIEDLAQDQEAVLDNDVATERVQQQERVKTDAELAARRKFNHETERQQRQEQDKKDKQNQKTEKPSQDNPGDEGYAAPIEAPDEEDDDFDDFDYSETSGTEQSDGTDEYDEESVNDDYDDEETNPLDEYDDEDEVYSDVDEYPEEHEEEEKFTDYSKEDLEQLNAQWITIEDEYLLDLDEDGNIVYDGKILPSDQAEYIRTQFMLMDGIDRQWLDQNSIPNGQMSDIQQMRNCNPEYIGNWLANTFFYAVDERRTESLCDKDEQGNPIVNQFNGVKLPKEIGTADELSKRLLQDNWLYNLQNKGKVYYIVTVDKGIQSVKKGTDKRDAYTISLVIEDDDKCFLTFLRDLGKTKYKDEKTGEIKNRNSELWWYNWLAQKNANVNLINQEMGGTLSEDHNERAGQIIKFIEQKTKDYLKTLYVARYGDEVGFENYLTGTNVVHNDEFSTVSRPGAIKAARRVVRGRYALNNQTLLGEEDIKAQIQKLRTLRNDIIKLYTNDTNQVSKTIRTDVVPGRLLQSNGRIDTQKNVAGAPIYRNLASDDISIQDIEKDFDDNTLIIGYGKGLAAYGNKFAVQNIKSQPNTNDGIFHGKGLSGKLYMLVKGLTRDAERVPIMLAEEKFNTQTRVKNGKAEVRYISNNGPIAVLDIVNGRVENVAQADQDGYTYMPSAAEVIFYMLCRRGQFANISSADKQRTVVDFIINNGERTLFEKRSGWEKRAKRNDALFNTLTSKQLAWFRDDVDKLGLSIGLPEFDEDRKQTIYKLHRFSEDELFAPEGTVDQEVLEQCRKNRQRCIAAIAQQMHWNTDQTMLNEVFDGAKLGFTQLKDDIGLQTKPRDQFNSEEEYLQQTYNILGCPELSFNLGDILSSNTGFKNISWLIKNGKLKTDASPAIFKDPYVFAIGAKKTGPVDNADNNIGVDNDNLPPTPPKGEPKGGINYFQDDVAQMLSDVSKPFIATNEDKRKQLVDQWNSKYSKSNRYKIIDRIAVIRNTVYETDWDGDSYADENMIKQIVDEISITVIEAWKKKNPSYVLSDKINVQLFEDDLEYLSQDEMPLVVQFDTTDGKNVNVTVSKHDFQNGNNELNTATFFSGVYKEMSTMNMSNKSLDENKARKWLFQKLGIEGYNVWVQKGAINGANGKLAYGATTLACDAITNQIVAYFALSQQNASYGVEYHEAFHYVNLLLHDKSYRTAIYDEYVKYNKFAQYMSDDEVEELLADDFMKYVLAKEDKSIVGRIKNFFQNIVDLVNLVLNRKQYRRIYKNIVSGKYRFAKMNDQSVKDFQNKYGGFAYSTADNLQPILNEYSYGEVYEAVDSIVNQILIDNKAYGADRIKSLFNDNEYFENTFKPTIDNMIGAASEQRIGAQYIQLLEDLKLNKDFIKAHLAQKFSTLGFNVKFKNQVATDLEEKENNPDNTWDKLDISSSRKDNASAKIKLFLSTIPAKELITHNDGSVAFVDVKTKFGTTKLFDYDTVWGVVAGRLYNVESYEELRSKIRQFSKEHRVFNALEQRMRLLDNHNDSELKSQLFGICNAHVNHVQTINIANPFEREWEDEYDYTDVDEYAQGTGSFTNEVLDVTKEWSLSDDGAYNPGFTLPRNWSQSLASTSFVHYDPQTKGVTISGEFVYGNGNRMGIYKMVQTIDTLIAHQNKSIKDVLGADQETVDREYAKLTSAIQGKFLNLCNTLCIPIDSATLYHMFMRSDESADTSVSQAQRYYKFMVNLATDNNRGSVRDAVSHIQKAYDEGQDYVSIEGKQKAFDEIYNNLSLQSQIARFAINYSQVYPKLGEISTRNANGDKIYPINMNNFVSDRVTEANKRTVDFANDIKQSPYNGHSIIAQEISRIVPGNIETELRLNTFVGMKQKGGVSGNDYMEMTPMEDYLAKLFLTENDNLVFPTMADKKTWYSLSIGTSSKATKQKIGSTSGFGLQHSVIMNHVPRKILKAVAAEIYNKEIGVKDKSTGIIRENNIDRFRNDPKNKSRIEREALARMLSIPGINFRRFDDITIRRFRGYLLDEIAALKHFYSSQRIQSIIDDPSTRIENYDSNVDENGNMLFAGNKKGNGYGNGGLFRYLYNVEGYNMNHRLQALYEIEKRILKDRAHDNTAKEGDVFQNVSIGDIPVKYATKKGNSIEYDGFELIRQYLDQLEARVRKNAYDERINDWLIARVDKEMLELSDPNSAINIVEKRGNAFYPKAIPTQFLQPYFDKLKDLGFASEDIMYRVGDTNADEGVQSALYSLIGNHVINTLTSVIEIEKVFAGDPAFYIYKYKGKQTKVDYTHKFETGKETSVSLNIDDLTDPYSDKIKRLGGLLSPGTNLRLDFGEKFKRKNKGVNEDVSEIDLDIRTTSKYFENEDEIKGRAILATSKYTIVDANDVKCPSAQLDIIRKELKRQIVIDLIHTGLIKYNGSIQDLYNNDSKFDALYERVKDDKIDGTSIQDYVDNEVDIAADPYTDITVADAQVIIRPAMYRKIRIGLGDWTKDDERAYWLLETDDKWMEDAEKAKIVKKFQQYVLKMSYFDNDFSRAPVYNKMAIFPIFKFQRSTDVGEDIYNRMNKVGNEIDMIAFKSAIKVGATKDGIEVISKDATTEKGTSHLSEMLKLDSNKALDYSNGEIISNGIGNKISVRIQDLKNLRLQLNTHAHEDLVRAIGTQMFKIGFSNIVDNLTYGDRQRTGEDIRKHIMQMINKLTELGVQEMREQFYTTTDNGNYVIDADKVKQYMLEIIHNNGLGPVAEDIIASGCVASSLQSRKVFEQSISKKVNKEVVDIHTLGGTAVQQSCFGYEAFNNVISDEYVSYNGGKSLTWHKDNGTMEVLLSIKFFKSAVPAEHRRTYKEFRQYLIEHDMISGTKLDGTQNNPKPFGIGYRIPTQGMSSTFVFTVADVLPEQVGDLIIVPREFTAQTGSDFDIDKLYLATLSYKNGELEQYDENEPTKNAVSNELLLDYMDIIADKKNFFQSRGSIDTFTKILKHDLLPLLRNEQTHYFDGGIQLLPSFQSFRKMEFATGKTGIGPFALNVTNLALTQAARLTIDFENNEFQLGNLYDIWGKDHRMIAGWLSAMVNAHVDVAKDPYIFALNVNKATYNMCNFLIRTGNGLASFAFIAQPIIKLYAQKKNAKGGVYGKSLDLGSDNPYDTGIGSKLKTLYINAINKQLPQCKNGKVYKQALALIEHLQKDKEKGNDQPSPITAKFLRDELETSWPEIISLHNNIESLNNLKKGTPEALVQHYMHQILSLYAFERLDKYAQAMSSMVTASQIDTKRFGNDITQHRIWMNNHLLQKYEANVYWKIDRQDFPEPLDKDGKVDRKARTAIAMDHYFNSLFLEKKLNNAIKLTRDIAKQQLLIATDTFDYIFTDVMQRLYGEKKFMDYSNGSENGVFIGSGWDKVYDKEKPNQIANALDNICRFYAMLNLSQYLDTETVDLTLGKSKDLLVEKLQELYFGKEDKSSIFQRGADLINKLRNATTKEDLRNYRGLVDRGGRITNALLEYLSPMTESQNHGLGRFLLRDSSFDTGQDVKSNLRIAWQNLIDHPNEEVSNFAKDLILYAYYSKYDQNTPGSFFDIVPQKYRKQYDDALRNAMQILNNAETTTKDKINQLFDGVEGVDGIMDIMYRNYWYDDDVVVSYNYHDDEYDDSKGVDIFERENGETVMGGWQMDQEAGQSFPGMVVTNRIKLPYFKLRKNNTIYLYKKVATIQRLNKDISKANGSTMNVYVATPKAGYKEKNNIQFEFYADKYTDSIFSQNMLPKEFGEDVLKKALEERIKLHNNADTKYRLVLDWDEIPQTRMSDNMSAYIQVQDSDAYFNGRSVRSTNIIFSNIGDKSGQKAADVIFNIVTDPKSKFKDKRVNQKFEEKVMDIQFGTPLTAEQIENIKEIIAFDEEQVDKKHILHFVTGSFDSDFYNLDKLPKNIVKQIESRIEEIKKEHLEKYRAQLETSKLELEKIQVLVQDREQQFNPGEKQYNFAKQQAGIEIFNEFINTMVQDIVSSGISVNKLTTAASKTNVMTSLGTTHAANMSLLDITNTIYCNEKMPQTDRSTYSYIVGRVGRIAKADQIVIDEQLRKMKEQQESNEILEDAAQAVNNEDVSQTESSQEELTILQEAEEDDEDQNKNCESISDVLSNSSVDYDDDDF